MAEWKEEQNAKDLRQWHPAFFAGIQIELGAESKNLIFENEHQLGTKPKAIDVLIVKKEKDVPIRKNIGRIFRKHNIIEELTVTFVCFRYPRKLIKHLHKRNYYKVFPQEDGIYYVLGADFPIQIIVTNELDWEENMWLKSLTDKIDAKKVDEIAEAYYPNRKNPLYKSIMDIVVRANRNKFEEVKGMCDALRELFKDELEEQLGAAKAEAEEIGKEIGESRINTLNIQLSSLGRINDILKAAGDKEYQLQLLAEFNL